MKIVVVSTYYSVGMGYTENCLPKMLALLGHDVHLITSTLNVYGNAPDYDRTYRSFLGDAVQDAGQFEVDGYTVHRLPCSIVAGYVKIDGLFCKIRELRPDVVHSTAVVSFQAYVLAAMKPFFGFKLFTESHQHMSVVKPSLRNGRGALVERAIYGLTRTLPGALVGLASEKCYAIAPDCLQVANKFYGVPKRKLQLLSLGTDTELFHPAESADDKAERLDLRMRLGYVPEDVVCVYTGRLSAAKNPLVLAQAIEHLSGDGFRFHGLFIGEGEQHEAILKCRNTTVLPFMRHSELAGIYRAADIAVWPTQESMSMLDAAASGLPIVVSADIGEKERVIGNGMLYRESDASDLARVLRELRSSRNFSELGEVGKRKMRQKFSWVSLARSVESDYRLSLA